MQNNTQTGYITSPPPLLRVHSMLTRAIERQYLEALELRLRRRRQRRLRRRDAGRRLLRAPVQRERRRLVRDGAHRDVHPRLVLAARRRRARRPRLWRGHAGHHHLRAFAVLVCSAYEARADDGTRG